MNTQEAPKKIEKKEAAPEAKKQEVKTEEKKAETATPLPLNVYTDKNARMQFIASGWMGDYGDLSYNDNFKENPRSGESCIQITYTAKRKNGAGWSGIYWQNPANNWGNKKGGFDLTGAKKLVFWARGQNGNETIAEFKIGGITGQNMPGDSDAVSIGPITLTRAWQKYEIPLEGKDLSHIIGGFAFSASADDNPNGFVIFLDDIYFE
jgi:hypothetical protein